MYIFIFSLHTWSYDIVNVISSETEELLEVFAKLHTQATPLWAKECGPC